MNYIIREIAESEYKVLDDFLYEAIFIPEGVSAPSREILYQPELQVYVDGFGTKDGDFAFVADIDGEIVGAVWTRIMNDYGHIDNDTPSFAISLYKEYRNLHLHLLHSLLHSFLTVLHSQSYHRLHLFPHHCLLFCEETSLKAQFLQDAPQLHL